MNEIKEKKFRVSKIVFYKEDSHWGILGTTPIDPLDGLEEELMNDFSNITVSGNFDGVYEGAEIIVSGDIVNNSRYGKQIQIRDIEVIQDTKSREGIVNFLAKSFIKGISTQNANKIYDKYKEESIKVVLNTPEVLSDINGIGGKTVEKVKASIDFYKSKEEAIEYCASLGINYTLTMKIISALGESAVETLKNDPYAILEAAPNISFKQIDDVFIKMGGNPLNPKRLSIGFLQTLKRIVTLEGSTGCYSYILKNKFLDLLSLQDSPEVFSKTADKLRREGKLEFGREGVHDVVYYKEYLDVEASIASSLYVLETEGYTDREFSKDVVESEIKDFPFTLNEKQVQAVHNCLDHRVSVLTGAAGCITGDSLIPCWISTLNGYRQDVTIKELYEKVKGKGPLMVRSLIEDEFMSPDRYIGEQSVEDIVYSGKKEVFELRLVCGRVLKATATHEIMTDSGFKFLKDLTKKDCVMIDAGSEDDRVSPSYSRVYSVTPLGVEDTYDICCKNHHNFVANGMVIHNSGKSSITKALYKIYNRSGFKTVLLSPTAKACRRLEECTGGSASTIHKFIGMKKDGKVPSEGGKYDKNTVLIVDEASMIDIILFNYLLKKVTPTTRILLIGDNNQLPSVQAGNVLGDIINSGKISVSTLTDVMRQQEDSHIIKFCNMINRGEMIDPCEYTDFHYEEFGTADELKEVLLKKYLAAVKEYSLQEVQVIAPYKQGEIGMNNLNIILQAAYQKINKGIEYTEGYRRGDRVRHTVNNYDKDVFNGETGIVVGYPDEELEVNYGNKIITYDSTELEELTLSYASTVHASQGSEYAVTFVVLDDTSSNDFLHIRRLLYTAVSRGKKKVYILTKPYLVDKCIVNDSYRPRITKLREFLEKKGNCSEEASIS